MPKNQMVMVKLAMAMIKMVMAIKEILTVVYMPIVFTEMAQVMELVLVKELVGV